MVGLVETEIWADISGYEGEYQVSSQGRVRSVERVAYYLRAGVEIMRKHRSVVLAPNDNGNGYLSVCLGRDNRRYVHRMVCAAFCDNHDSLPEVNHKDGNTQNNVASNLEWCNRLYNIGYKETTDTQLKGDRAWNAKLNNANVKQIKSMVHNKEARQCDIAKAFGVSRETICGILHGRTWRHV